MVVIIMMNNLNNIMETETISKTGQDLQSRKSRKN